MELSNTSSINRINLDALEARTNNSLLRQPLVSAASNTGASASTPAGPITPPPRSIAPESLGDAGGSVLSRELTSILSDLRSSLADSALSAGQQFRSTALNSFSSFALQQATPVAPTALNSTDSASIGDVRVPSVNAASPPPLQSFPLDTEQAFDSDLAASSTSARLAQPDPRLGPAPEAPESQDAQEPNIGDATLSSLSTSLNLQSAAGRFQLDVNGQTLNFRADQTLNDVLTGLSAPGSGVRASLDPRERRIDIESTNGRPISIIDRTGNLSSGLGIEVTPSADTNASLGRGLQDFARGLNRAINFLEDPNPGPRSDEADRVLSDLKSTLNSLFTPSRNGRINGLGDLGFSRRNGELQFDENRLNELVERNPDEVNRVAGTVTRNAAPLLAAGERAARELESSLSQARSSTQDVRIFGEIQRLQLRQQALELDRISISRLRNRVAEQGEFLARLAENLETRSGSLLPRPAQEAREFARDVAAARPRRRPALAMRLPDPPLGNVPATRSRFVLNRDLT
jgi:hypothetical protein